MQEAKRCVFPHSKNSKLGRRGKRKLPTPYMSKASKHTVHRTQVIYKSKTMIKSNSESESMSKLANCVGVTLGRAHFASVLDGKYFASRQQRQHEY